LTKSFWIRIRNLICSPLFFISVGVGFYLLVRYRIGCFIAYYSKLGPVSFFEMGDVFLNDLCSGHTLSGFSWITSILAALPTATLYCDDCEWGYIRFILSRKNRMVYLKETYWIVSVVGGLTIAVPCTMATLFFLAFGKLNIASNNVYNYATSFDETVYGHYQFIWGGIALALFLIVLSFVFGALWASIGLLISFFWANKYATVALPFIIYFMIHLMLYQNGKLLVFSPATLIMPNITAIPYPLFPLICLLAYVLIVYTLYSNLVRIKIEDV